MSSPVLRDFIDRELQNGAPNLNPDTRSRLSKIAEAFVNNQISFNYALNIFTECCCPPSLITKFAHIKAVGDDPLSAPNSYSPDKLSTQDIQQENPINTKYNSDQAQPKNNIESTPTENDNQIQGKPPGTKVYTRKKALIWTEDEDMRLLTAVCRFGNHDWRMISAFVGNGRTSSQCNQRWTRALNPSISHHSWTAQEDQKLCELVAQMGECGWRKIASYLEGRTDLQCRHRYLQMKRSKEKALQKEKESAQNSIETPQSIQLPRYPISQELLKQLPVTPIPFNLPPQNTLPAFIEPTVFVQNQQFSMNLHNRNSCESMLTIEKSLSSAMPSFPQLQTISDLPFQRLPPLLFQRKSNSSLD